jgi:hypothetical protein
MTPGGLAPWLQYRGDYLWMCDRDPCAALMLSLLVFKARDGEEWQERSEAEYVEALFGAYCERKIRTARDLLMRLGYIERDRRGGVRNTLRLRPVIATINAHSAEYDSLVRAGSTPPGQICRGSDRGKNAPLPGQICTGEAADRSKNAPVTGTNVHRSFIGSKKTHKNQESKNSKYHPPNPPKIWDRSAEEDEGGRKPLENSRPEIPAVPLELEIACQQVEQVIRANPVHLDDIPNSGTVRNLALELLNFPGDLADAKSPRSFALNHLAKTLYQTPRGQTGIRQWGGVVYAMRALTKQYPPEPAPLVPVDVPPDADWTRWREETIASLPNLSAEDRELYRKVLGLPPEHPPKKPVIQEPAALFHTVKSGT